MAKEICISSTPHETRLAILEDDQLAEIYYERENEYTLAGSIYNGRVTRVLPGMQSAFVDLGLERDAFLYVTDFMELEDPEETDELERPRPAAPTRLHARSGTPPRQTETAPVRKIARPAPDQDRARNRNSGRTVCPESAVRRKKPSRKLPRPLRPLLNLQSSPNRPATTRRAQARQEPAAGAAAAIAAALAAQAAFSEGRSESEPSLEITPEPAAEPEVALTFRPRDSTPATSPLRGPAPRPAPPASRLPPRFPLFCPASRSPSTAAHRRTMLPDPRRSLPLLPVRPASPSLPR